VSDARRVLRQALTLVILSVVAGAAVHLSLIKKFARGEFRDSFFEAAEYPGFRLITIEEAEDLWHDGTAVFIDARRASFFGEGRVPRALNVPASETSKTLPAEILALARERTLVVYCEGGDCQSSLLMAKRLHGEGFKDIRVMTGGWSAWQAAGLPEEKSDGQK
jgi:rhodanese-related sulfurtransferase